MAPERRNTHPLLGAAEGQGLELLADMLRVSDREVAAGPVELALIFRRRLWSTQGLGIYRYAAGSWVRVPGQELDILSRRAIARVREPGSYALLAPRPPRTPPPCSPIPNAEDSVARAVAGWTERAAEVLCRGLTKSMPAITPAETGMLRELRSDGRFRMRVYLNRYGQVRWSEDDSLVGRSYEELVEASPPATDAVESAFRLRAPVGCRVPGTREFEVALPLGPKERILGMLLLRVEKRSALGG